jgi:hypothetical protein
MKVTSNPARARSAPTPAPFAPTLMAAILGSSCRHFPRAGGADPARMRFV